MANDQAQFAIPVAMPLLVAGAAILGAFAFSSPPKKKVILGDQYPISIDGARSALAQNVNSGQLVSIPDGQSILSDGHPLIIPSGVGIEGTILAEPGNISYEVVTLGSYAGRSLGGRVLQDTLDGDTNVLVEGNPPVGAYIVFLNPWIVVNQVIAKTAGVGGTVLQLASPIYRSFKVSQGATYQLLNEYIVRPEINNLTVLGNGNTGPDTIGVYAFNVINPVIRNLVCKDLNGSGYHSEVVYKPDIAFVNTIQCGRAGSTNFYSDFYPYGETEGKYDQIISDHALDFGPYWSHCNGASIGTVASSFAHGRGVKFAGAHCEIGTVLCADAGASGVAVSDGSDQLHFSFVQSERCGWPGLWGGDNGAHKITVDKAFLLNNSLLNTTYGSSDLYLWADSTDWIIKSLNRDAVVTNRGVNNTILARY